MARRRDGIELGHWKPGDSEGNQQAPDAEYRWRLIVKRHTIGDAVPWPGARNPINADCSGAVVKPSEGVISQPQAALVIGAKLGRRSS